MGKRKEIPEKWKKIMIKDLGMQYPKKTSKQKKRTIIFCCQKCGCDVTRTINCLNRENATPYCKSCQLTKHGYSAHPLKAVYQAMLQRCYNEKNPGYKYYGKRGISVCNEWRDSFENFIEWSFNSGYENGLEIDRTSNDGNYEPSNCRWETRSNQMRNTRRNIKITQDEASEVIEFKYSTNTPWRDIANHIGMGMSSIKQIAYGNYEVKGNHVFTKL